MVPFRWNFGNPRLWRRIGGERAPAPPAHLELHENVLRCAAAILRGADDADIYFVGRSLENVHDFLSGALLRTSARRRLHHLQLSLRFDSLRRLNHRYPGALEKLWPYFESLELTPSQILARSRPVAFADLVYSGHTFRILSALLRFWLDDEARWPRLRERLRWVCVVAHDEPNRERWRPENHAWTAPLRQFQFRSLRIPWKLWRYLGEEQLKTTESYGPIDWGYEGARWAPMDAEHLEAARMARSFYRLGQRWRRRLAGELEKPVMPSLALDVLVRELRTDRSRCTMRS